MRETNSFDNRASAMKFAMAQASTATPIVKEFDPSGAIQAHLTGGDIV